MYVSSYIPVSFLRSACWKWSTAHNPEEVDQVHTNQGTF